jgi:Tfp pilus assembly protein PilO
VKRQVPIVAIVAPAVLIVALVGYFLLVKPKQDESGRLAAEVTELEGKVDRALAASHEAPSREPAAPTIRVADLFQLTKAMPDRVDMPGILLELDSVASESGVRFSSIAPSAATPATGFTKVPINLTFEGNYYDLADFLFRLRNLVIVRDGELEADGRLFSLDSVSMQEGPHNFPEIQAGLTVTAYVYSPAAGADAAAALAPTTPADTGQALGGTG